MRYLAASECSTKRGALFRSNESTTWQSLDYYALGLDPQLGFGHYGSYGVDSIALSDTITAPSQIVSVINSTDYWLGFLGLGVKPTNFTSTQKATFLSSMVENQSLIPSHSFGYTAGAHYRLKSVPASLTLGGYDVDRLIPHDVTFDLDPDQKPVVALNNVQVSAKPVAGANVSTGWAGDTLRLGTSESDGFYTIDSSTPYLWLPRSMCDNFAQALGLEYDDSLELYTFGKNTTQHQILLDWNLTFTFEVTNLPGSSNAVELSLPYDAFDLNLSYPFPGLSSTPSSAPVNYFPLRRAANSSQFTIGRAFLQETYLMVDYERNNFSISQAKFDTNALNDITLVDITRPHNTTFAGPRNSKKKSHLDARRLGLIVGVVVGIVAIAASLSFFYLKRRRSRARNGMENKKNGRFRVQWFKFCAKALHISIPENAFEVAGSTSQAKEISADGAIGELGDPDQKELEANDSASSFGARSHGKRPVPAIGHDLTHPVELETSSKGVFEEHGLDVPSPTVPPPYSPDHIGQDYLSSGNNTSISGVSSESKGAASHPSTPHSSPAFVSPMTPRFPKTATYTLVDLHRPEGSGGSQSSQGESSSRYSTAEDRSSHGLPDSSSQQSPRRFSWEDTM